MFRDQLIREICAIILYFITPISLVVIGYYIDSPIVDALSPGVILAGFRLLEAVAGFGIMFAVWLLISKILRPANIKEPG
jgi:hypothetical protein